MDDKSRGVLYLNNPSLNDLMRSMLRVILEYGETKVEHVIAKARKYLSN